MKSIQEYKTQMITYRDKQYPQKLKNIIDFPICVFYKGDINLLSKPILAIIGSRECSEYGRKVTIELSEKIAKENIIIATGGARGIDSLANIGAIIEGRPSIIVLGNSLDVIYPPENKELEEMVLQNGGLIISEYMNTTIGNKNTFPERNRIISGISDGILITEAREKSGALITADFALEQGKEIYVVPGNIFLQTTAGTNGLIKEGAKVVTNYNDIIEDFKI